MSCGGPSADTDELPQWVKSINAELVSNFDLSKCPRLEQTVASSETMDDSFTCAAGFIEDGDTVFFHGEQSKVYAVAPSFNSPRNETIRVTKDFVRHHKSQSKSVKIFRPPKLEGFIMQFPSSFVTVHRPFCVDFKVRGNFNVGDVEVIFENMIFNELGYLSHDTVVSLT